jgi:hypothetical protein
MDSTIRLLLKPCLLYWAITGAIGLAQEKPAVPSGYENAPVAGGKTPVEEAAAQEAPIPAEVDVQQVEVVADANVARIEKQFLPQFQAVWKTEMAFLRRAARLNEDQRKKIHESADRVVKAAARKFAVAQNRLMHGNGMIIAQRAPRTMPDPYQLIQQQLMQIAKGTLNAEQEKRYREECDKRSASRELATVQILVSLLDERLVLLPEQREKLVESLSSHYEEVWGRLLEVLEQNPQLFPAISNSLMLPVLDQKQREIWKRTQKIGPGFWGGMGFANHGVVIADEEIAVEAEKEDD